jgi:methyltransferase-like protein/2-polyprenyl-3-methyl-5-hydroxy-6-metoxy-1,4-benzoquinol methylase
MPAMLPASSSSYDEVTYESFPIIGTHPDRLSTLARLMGVETPTLATCRVLELGCAGGGNLVPMALQFPGAQFTGVDLSAVQIAAGNALVQTLHLDNVRLIAANVMDIGDDFGQFDYVIAHGIFSWVPHATQEKILEICNRNMAPNGVAYVGYNTLPGWRMRGTVRDLMRYHALQFPEPEQRVAHARAMLDFLARGVPDENSAYAKLLRSELDLLRQTPDFYILYEHLAEVNEPVYFHEFVERAFGHGLQYLSDAEFPTMLASRFPPQVADTIRRMPDVIRQEQIMDFLSNRAFRQTLLMHLDQPVDRAITPQRLQSLWVASCASPARANPNLAEGIPERFCTPAGPCATTSRAITKAALLVLAGRWPVAVALPELVAAAYARLNPLAGKPPQAEDFELLGAELLQCYAGAAVELHACPSPFSIEPGTRPVVNPLARFQAGRAARVSTLRHESIVVPDAIRALLPLLDGTRTLEDVSAEIRTAGSSMPGKLAEPAALRTAIDQIARNALMPKLG